MATTVVFKGKLIKANRVAKTFEGKKQKEKTHISLAEVAISDDTMKILKEAFKKSGKKFTPKWINEFEGFVNVSTIYDIPTKNLVEGTTHLDILDVEMPTHNSEVTMSVVVKEGALYPKAIKIYTEGEEYDAFSDLDADEEEELPFE